MNRLIFDNCVIYLEYDGKRTLVLDIPKEDRSKSIKYDYNNIETDLLHAHTLISGYIKHDFDPVYNKIMNRIALYNKHDTYTVLDVLCDIWLYYGESINQLS